MPKVRPLGDTWESRFRAEVKYRMEMCGIKSNTELAKRMCIPKSTLFRHLKDPSIMTVDELRRLTRTLGMNAEDKGKLF